MTTTVTPDLAARISAALSHAPTGLLIGESFRPSSSGKEFDVNDPATGQRLTSVADASPADALEALETAHRSQKAWAATPPRHRGDILRRAYELILERKADLALLMTLEMGKPLVESEAEITYGADFLRWFSEEAVRFGGRASTSPTGDTRIVTVQEPVGPSLLVTPWNFPLAMGTRKIGPALAAGCTVIVKPAALTPLSMNALGAILIEAGLPAGVLSIIPTSSSSPTVASLMSDRRLRKISFTGSTEVGKQLIRQSADQVLRVSMELGGNAPLIVCSDADVPHAAAEAMKAKLRNNGEACTAANVFWVHESVLAEFTAQVAAQFDELTVGPGYAAETNVGPIIDQRSADGLQELVEDALQRGAKIVSQRPSPENSGGSYFPPTLLTDVPRDARVVQEEIFGPIAPIVSWSDEDDLFNQLNASEYGLAAYLFTDDLTRARVFAERLEVGMVGINRGVLSNVAAPFGGIKHSGYGREGADVGINEYLSTKYLSVDAPL